MIDYLIQYYQEVQSFTYILSLINLVLHILFATAVAQDIGKLNSRGYKTVLVSGMTWTFATLIGGVWTALAYWAIHNISFTTKPN